MDLETRMKNPKERKKIQDWLNGSALYYRGVKACKLTAITIRAQRKDGSILSYTSLNSPETGKITEIVDGEQNPNLVARVKEEVLLKILKNHQFVTKYPKLAMGMYGLYFRIAGKEKYVETALKGYD